MRLNFYHNRVESGTLVLYTPTPQLSKCLICLMQCHPTSSIVAHSQAFVVLLIFKLTWNQLRWVVYVCMLDGYCLYVVCWLVVYCMLYVVCWLVVCCMLIVCMLYVDCLYVVCCFLYVVCWLSVGYVSDGEFFTSQCEWNPEYVTLSSHQRRGVRYMYEQGCNCTVRSNPRETGGSIHEPVYTCMIRHNNSRSLL